MSSQVLIDPHILASLQLALRKFAEKFDQIKNQAQMRVDETQEHVRQREKHWRRVQEQTKRDLERAQRAYHDCLARNARQDCRAEEQAKTHLEQQLTQISEHLAAIQSLQGEARRVQEQQDRTLERLERAMHGGVAAACESLAQSKQALWLYAGGETPSGSSAESRGAVSQQVCFAAGAAAIRALRYERADKGLREPGWIQRAGAGGEGSAWETMSNGAENMNRKNPNYPIYDAMSSEELASVKTHAQMSDSDKRHQAYYRDWNKMNGCGRAYSGGRSPIENDALRLQDYLKNHSEVPAPAALRSALSGMSPEKNIADYLSSETVLRIPDDDVDGFIGFLKEHGVDPAGRVRGLGLTNIDIRRLADGLTE